jgi:hypothetical protein
MTDTDKAWSEGVTMEMADSVRGVLQMLRGKPGATFADVREHCSQRGDDLSRWPAWIAAAKGYVTEQAAATMIFQIMQANAPASAVADVLPPCENCGKKTEPYCWDCERSPEPVRAVSPSRVVEAAENVRTFIAVLRKCAAPKSDILVTTGSATPLYISDLEAIVGVKRAPGLTEKGIENMRKMLVPLLVKDSGSDTDPRAAMADELCNMALASLSTKV